MSRPKTLIPIVMWLLVLITGGWLLYVRNQTPSNETGTGGDPVVTQSDGRVLLDVPWNHLPGVGRFVLTDQSGAAFDSAELHGRPYVVSFFFASCTSFCRDLNNELSRVNRALKDTDIQFLTITVDPDVDTTQVLAKYAAGYDANPDRWAFLSGPIEDLKRVGENMFQVVVDRDTHTDNILLVDKWGRYRDRFKWDQPEDMKRFLDVAREVAAEKSPPLNQTVRTRNALAGARPENPGSIPWFWDFHLKLESGEDFFSRDLTGRVWLVQFYDPLCPACQSSDRWLQSVSESLVSPAENLVRIAVQDPDAQAVSQRDADLPGSGDRVGRVVSGTLPIVTRIANELFQTAPHSEHTASIVFLVDKWGNVRGKFDVSDESQRTTLVSKIQSLSLESVPPRPE